MDAPVAASGRLQSLDVLRAVALLGIIVVNVMDYAPAPRTDAGRFIGRLIAIFADVVLSSSGARAHERSSVVTLADAFVSTNLATLGASLEFAAARIAMEYTKSTVPSVSMKIGFAR